MSRYRLTTSALVAAELTHIWKPGNPRALTKRPVVICHSAGSVDDGAGVALPHFTQLASVLARGSAATAGQGMPIIGGYMTGKFPFGNDASVGRIETMRVQIGASSGADASKVALLPVSMGAGAAFRYAAANPTKVSSINAIIPMSSLLNFYKSNFGGSISVAGVNAMSIAAAWGLSYTVLTVTATNGSPNLVATAGAFTAPMAPTYLVIKNTGNRQAIDSTIPIGTTLATFTDATHAIMSAPFTGVTGSYQIAVAQPLPTGVPATTADLLALGPAIAAAGIPTRLFYSTVDQYVDPADTIALAAGCGGTAIPIDTTLGHVDGTIAQLATYNGGTAFSDLVANLVTNGC
jgi:pimeloyl-ACP methyl ester carboxylesterase